MINPDSVSSLVNACVIDKIKDSPQHDCAVDVAANSSDTSVEVENILIESIPGRRKHMHGQTPQAFRLEAMSKAYTPAEDD